MSEIEAGAVVQIDGGEERGKILKRVGSWWHIKMEGEERHKSIFSCSTSNSYMCPTDGTIVKRQKSKLCVAAVAGGSVPVLKAKQPLIEQQRAPSQGGGVIVAKMSALLRAENARLACP